MLRSVTLTKFKKFSSTSFSLREQPLTFLAGPNNSGKSSFLQALAVWEFTKTVLEMERGRKSLHGDYKGQGLGLADDEFSPMAIASLKHLWTNLKSQGGQGQNGYSLKISCSWNGEDGATKSLGMALALANDRLFIKSDGSNLTQDDHIPRIAYLPPFAGITSREPFMSPADRRAMTGKGLAGAVIRNFLLDMNRANEYQRKIYKGDKRKISNKDLAKLRSEDAWEILQQTLVDVFGTQISVSPFNDIYHNYIKVNTTKGSIENGRYRPYKNFNARDLMAEGSGLLQWLSVYTLALSESVDVLLLDEPDAHLHPSLQSQLIEKLVGIAGIKGKQILLATHSTEILRHAEASSILGFRNNTVKYLQNDSDKTSLFLGLGSDYAPKLDPLRKNKRMIIVENLSDWRTLCEFYAAAGRVAPKNVVPWPWVGSHKERKQLFLQLKDEIPDLKALSLRDRDETEIGTVDPITLRDKTTNNVDSNISYRIWRRRHIENYVLWPEAIAEASGRNVTEVNDFFATHSLIINADFPSRDAPSALLDAHGKEIAREGANSLAAKFSVTPEEIIRKMHSDNIPADVIAILDQIDALAL